MEIQQILQFSFQTLSKPSLSLLNLTLPSFKWLANTMLGYFPLNSLVEKIKNLTNKFNGLNTILLYFLKSDSCYIIYWARILLFHKIPITAGILLNSRKTSPSCVISHCVKSRYGPAEEFFFTFPFLAHSLVLGASLYLHFSPPPFSLHPAFSLWGASAWHRQSLWLRAASQRLDSPVWCIGAEPQPASLHTLINVHVPIKQP